MNIFKRYAEFTKLIGQDHRRIVELERIITNLTDRVFKLEEIDQSKDTYIDNVIKQHNIK